LFFNFIKTIIMKAIVIITCFGLLVQQVIAQSTPEPVLSKADYLQKSKNQNTAAWILLGGGAVMTSVGMAIGINEATDALGSIFTGEPEEPSSTGSILFFTGAAAMLGSIPLFIASSRNKGKANSLSAFFKIENRPLLQQSSFTKTSYPALGIKINL
jgi:hypothetical protein